MKYLVLHGDGMADYPIPELGGKTPLQAANTPAMDYLSSRGMLGMVRTIPEGFPPGSDVGSLSLFGFDPRRYYTGRSPLEAAALGIGLGPGETSFRANLVCLAGGRFADEDSGEIFEGAVMEDFTAGHITSADGKELISAIDAGLGGGPFRFYPGKSYRNLMIATGVFPDLVTTPPHDITGRMVLDHLPRGEGRGPILRLMEESVPILAGHPVNFGRKGRGEPTANSLWLWGQGTAPRLPSFRERFGLSGSVISAVDLVRGIAVLLGLKVIEVPGATGYLDTDYRGKVEAAFSALESDDFAYVHVEAPDEASHTGDLALKLRALEDFDQEIVGRTLDAAGGWEGRPRTAGGQDVRLMLFIDHRTPISLKTHSSEPVPFAVFPMERRRGSGLPYDEVSAEQTGVFFENGEGLMGFCLSD